MAFYLMKVEMLLLVVEITQVTPTCFNHGTKLFFFASIMRDMGHTVIYFAPKNKKQAKLTLLST
jgi:cephalosporin hydroxylase